MAAAAAAAARALRFGLDGKNVGRRGRAVFKRRTRFVIRPLAKGLLFQLKLKLRTKVNLRPVVCSLDEDSGDIRLKQGGRSNLLFEHRGGGPWVLLLLCPEVTATMRWRSMGEGGTRGLRAPIMAPHGPLCQGRQRRRRYRPHRPCPAGGRWRRHPARASVHPCA